MAYLPSALAAGGSSSKSTGRRRLRRTTSFQAGQGNAGVAQIVSSTNGAIGYVDFSDAKAANLKFASIKSSARSYRHPDPGGRVRGRERGEDRGRPDVQPLERTGRRRVPDHVPDLDHRVRKADRRREGAPHSRLPDLRLNDGQSLAEGANFAKLPSRCNKGDRPAVQVADPGRRIVSATLNGSGSTFQKTFDQVVIQAFQQKNSGITVNYAGGGSGKGKTDLQTKTVDFAGTDSLVKAADLPNYQGGAILYFPIAAAPITVSFNVSGVDSLKLSGPTVAQIFSGKITKWNDPAIATDNAGVTLPNTNITVVHRADASGTTSNFTKYLVAAGALIGSWERRHVMAVTRAMTAPPCLRSRRARCISGARPAANSRSHFARRLLPPACSCSRSSGPDRACHHEQARGLCHLSGS